MKNKFSKSNTRAKSVLFLFLGLLISFTVKSQVNCQIIDTAIVADVSCYNGLNGSIDLEVLDPTGLYSYQWIDDLGLSFSVSQDVNGLLPATYQLIITDLVPGSNCIQDTSFTITQPQDPLSTATTLYSNVDCFGDSSGIAFAENAIGGTFPYTYSWNTIPIQNSQLAVNLWGDPLGFGSLFPFSHTVTVTDANGCTVQSSIDIINSHPPITGDAIILNQVSCFGACDANVEFSSGGGVLPHTYNWDVGQVYNGSGPDTAFNLCYGGHDVLIEDAIGCRNIIPFIITQPDELFASAVGNGAPIPGQLPTQPVQCFGFDNGTAYASATQGTAPYTYVWDSINGPEGQYIDSLAPGLHTIYVTDFNGCTDSDTVFITEPNKLVVEIDSSLVIYAYCSNTFSGELCAVASGGTPNYAYAWNDVIIQTTPCAYNLRPDQYTITVMDDRNCIAQASFDLDSITNSMNTDSVNIMENPLSCFGLYDGALTASSVVGGLGGVGPYIYNWTGPNSYTGTNISISSLYFGSYGLVIEDSNGCQITTGAYLNQPDQLEYNIYNTVDETCLGADNGQIWVNINGGTGQYYYDLLEANSFPIPSANQVPIINDSLIYNLASGLHLIYITDDNDCEGAVVFGAGTAGWQANINPLITIPAPLYSSTPTTCYNTNNGIAQVLDPDPLYTYTWENDIGGNPSGIDISNGSNLSWGAFAPGDYWLVSHYADSASFGIPYYGCDNSVPFTIFPGTTPIIDGETISNVSCYYLSDGQIDLNISGGVGPYDLYWDTTSVYPNGLSGNTSSIYTLSNLTVGTYAVTIIDSEGCIAIEDYLITEPTPIVSNITPFNVSCYGFDDGSAQVVVVTGTGTLFYEWNTVPITSIINTTSTAADLFAGTYTVTVSDIQGCNYIDTVEILEPADPIALVEVDSLYYGPYDVSCFGLSNASAFATGSGVLFTWEDENLNPVLVADPTGQNTGPILSAGEYTVETEDINGCLGYATITITEPPELIISSLIESNPRDNGNGGVSPYHISCFGAEDGKAEIVIQGGVENYDITWLDEVGDYWDGDYVADNLAAGHSYTVTVNDANDCQFSLTTSPYIEPIEFIANVSTINYTGPFTGPEIISFIDSTISVESYSFEWVWQNGMVEYYYGVNQIDNKIFEHNFLKEELDTNFVFVMLTNEVTGCQDFVEFFIEVQGIAEINNVFTPNQDGTNDEFSFSEYGMESVDVQIFNRWGQLVYTWVGSDKSWEGVGIDGKDLPEGVYFYVFKGNGFDGLYYDKKGSITLLR